MDLKNLFCSATSALIAEIVTLPICTIKTVYQNNTLTVPQTINYIYTTNKIKGFFIASKPAIISQVISTASKYTIYEKIKQYRNTRTDDIKNNMINGMACGLIGCIITHPIDVWKNVNQRQESYIKFLNNNKKYIISKGLYQGFSGSIGKNIVLYSCLFPINDYFKNKFNSFYISAPLTSITVSLIIQPFDYYKVVKMAGNKIINPYRGLTLLLARSIPHFALTMILTNYLTINF